MTQTLLKSSALSAFCPSRPTPEEVTAFLAKEGRTLVCALDPVITPASRAAPGQYHYQDRDRTEVISSSRERHPRAAAEAFPPICHAGGSTRAKASRQTPA